MAENSRKFVARSRPARVQIAYSVEFYGAERETQLPFVVGVLADLAVGSTDGLPPLAERKFMDVDIDSFDSCLRALRPRVEFAVPDLLRGEGELAINLAFESIDDFTASGVTQKVGALAELLDARAQIASLASYMDGKTAAEALVADVLLDGDLLASLAAGQLGAVCGEALAKRLERDFQPRTDAATRALEASLRTLAREVRAGPDLTTKDGGRPIDAVVRELDRRLSRQLDLVMHHKQFLQLEGTWRGLHYLVSNTETDEQLKIRVMHLSKAELGRTLAKSTTWNQNPLFKRVHEDVYTTFGGEPFACLVGDYTFDHSPADVALLRDLARICAASHAPFMAAASPALLGLQSWRELARFRPSPKRFVTDEYLAWRRLSESDESRHLAFAMPRFLARAPYGGNGTEVEDFDYQEDVGEGDPDRHPWCNAAYAMAVNITRAFKLYGWCARICGIESGGAVEGLPTHRFPTRAGEIDSKCPVEIALDDRVEAELAALGLMPLLHRKNSDFAAFIGACSLHKPFQYDDPATTASARLAARLPYLLACNRFVQVIKCLVRDRVGSFVNVSEMERSLQRWIANYVDPEPDVSSDARAARPLAAADVRVDEVEGNPGYYALCCWLRPHYQLEGLSVSLRVVSQLPAAKALM